MKEAKTRRGPYAQGRQSRELILEAALEVIGRKGYSATSLREIAAEVGLTQAGLLHHFGSRENLLTEVLRRRDEVNVRDLADTSPEVPLLIRVVRRNEQVPGLVHLYVSLAAAAADPEHPAREFFRKRNATLQQRVAAEIRERQEAGEIEQRIDAEHLARIFISLSDGLQAQWLIDPSIDLAHTLELLWESLIRK